jgi:small conductance mechanosensitive channel
VLGQLQLPGSGAEHVPTTLLGSCGANPGLMCRLVWNLSHNGRAATLTSDIFADPVHVLLKVLFVVVLAFAIQALVHRTINRLSERAALSILPQLRNGASAKLRPAGLAGRRLLRRRGKADPAVAAGTTGVQDSPPAPADPPSQGEFDHAAAQAEAAMVDERRKQRVRALGSILRSASSIAIFVIAGFIILGDLSINLAPLLASAGVVGVAVGFGAQTLVKDYLSGIFMLVEDQYGVGDVITIGNATGTVESVTLRVTRMRDVNGIVWHIRNGIIDTVGNESQGWARAVIDFPVPFAADLGTIKDLLARTGDEMWNQPAWRVVMLEAPEVWGAQEVTKDAVTMRVVVRTAPLRQWEVEREMRARVKHALAEASIMPPPVETPKMTVTLASSE